MAPSVVLMLMQASDSGTLSSAGVNSSCVRLGSCDSLALGRKQLALRLPRGLGIGISRVGIP